MAPSSFRMDGAYLVGIARCIGPTPPEAAAIAFPYDDTLFKLLREYSAKLGIKNIRVMKKIERLVGIVVSAVPNLSDDIRRQIVHSLVIFGWCKFDSGANPPPLGYLGEGALARAVERQTSKTTPSEDERRWDAIRAIYRLLLALSPPRSPAAPRRNRSTSLALTDASRIAAMVIWALQPLSPKTGIS